MVEAGRSDSSSADLRRFSEIPKHAGKERQDLCWLDIEPIMKKLGQWKQGNSPDSVQINADLKEKPSEVAAKTVDLKSYSLTNSADVIERLQHTYDGSLFPDKTDKAFATKCECLQKDMKAWSKKVDDGGNDADLCKEGAQIHLRLAGLMRDPKLNRLGPADYNYSRALELAVASEDQKLVRAICTEYSKFLKDSFPSDKGKQAKAAKLDEIAKTG